MGAPLQESADLLAIPHIPDATPNCVTKGSPVGYHSLQMTDPGKNTRLRWFVAGMLALAFIAWTVVHVHELFATQNGLIRSVLTLLFAFLILVRPKNTVKQRFLPRWVAALGAVAGTVAFAIGTLLHIQQIQWVGLLVLLAAGLEWSLPPTYSMDILLCLLVLYWAAPIPTVLFDALQATMQRLSVIGSEWFMHVINVRAWADNLLIYTGANIYEVPAYCSGMRTATTVLILSIALGILRRLRWFETAMMVALALAHALILNVLRITAMVTLAPKVGPGSGLDYLHDTAGTIVIAGVLIVYIEIEIFRKWKVKRRAHKEDLNPGRLNLVREYPPFWNAVVHHKWLTTAIVLLLLLAGFLVYRSRPYHRAMMIKDVATGLRDLGNVDLAQKATSEVRILIPDNIEWRFTAIRLLLIRGENEEVISELDAMTELQGDMPNQKRILKAYALMSLGRMDEAIAIVETLPERARREDPRVAMILAEMALRSNDPDRVAVHIVTASGWTPNAGRIRNLYPFLRIHHKWKAMANSHIDVPFHDPVQALSILEALMNLNQVPKVAEITYKAARKWPTDARILEPLFFMAIKRDSGHWETDFADHLRRCVRVMDDPDKLYELLYKCFKLGHPDLGWAVYRRIEAIDPEHPALGMAIAKHGHQWLSYRRRPLGLPAGRSGARIDLRPFLVLGRMLPESAPLIEFIPHHEPLTAKETIPFRKQQLARAIRAFEKREIEKTLTLDMQYLFVTALEMARKVPEAKALLKRIVERDPGEKQAARVVLSEVYERAGDWVNVYETLRDYLRSREATNTTQTVDTDNIADWPPEEIRVAGVSALQLIPLMRLIEAQIELNFGLAAIYTAREAKKLYPFVPQIDMLLAKALARYDSPEEALFLLSEPRVRNQLELDVFEIELLFETERYNEAKDFCRTARVPQIAIPRGSIQKLSMPPAELALLWHRVSIPSEAEFSEKAAIIEKNLSTASPALQTMMRLWLSAWRDHCRGAIADPHVWEQLGRDRLEKATALSNLTMLLCREERFETAGHVAERAVELFPESFILWRILLSLRGPSEELLRRARQACPKDPDLWLADLVFRTRKDRPEATPASGSLDAQIETEIRNLSKREVFSAGTMTRAGEYLFRGGLTNAAVVAARYAVEHANGLLPAYALGIKCAVIAGDEKWSLYCTERAIESSLHPLPMFYENLVMLKISDGEIDTDPDMVHALRALKKEDPHNALWPQMLGYIRFARGGWEVVDALQEMDAAIRRGATNRTPYLVAAEASRLLGNYARAADHLRRGLEHSPHHVAMLNNLAFVLAHDPETAQEAFAMTPRLLAVGNDHPQIHDTIAYAALRVSELDRAEQAIAALMDRVSPGSPLWFRGRMLLADLAFQRGNPEEAKATLRQVLRSARGMSDEDILEANTLLGEIDDTINPEDALFRSSTPIGLE